MTNDHILYLTSLKPKCLFSGIDNTGGTWRKRQTKRLLVNIGSDLHTFLRQYDETWQIYEHPSLLNFTDNRNEPDRTDENFDWLWKIRDLFEILYDTFSKFYNPSENLAFDEVIIPFKGRVIFKQYIPKKRKRFGIKIFKLCEATGYAYDMKLYLGKDRLRTAQHVTATHATVAELMRKIEGRGNKLYMDNFFSSPELFNDLVTKQIQCCGTVRPKRKGMP
jgi:hypothetical protein